MWSIVTSEQPKEVSYGAEKDRSLKAVSVSCRNKTWHWRIANVRVRSWIVHEIIHSTKWGVQEEPHRGWGCKKWQVQRMVLG